MKQKGWKIVRRLGCHWISSTVDSGVARVYGKDTDTLPEPDAGPLAVFDSEVHAHEFALEQGLWRSEYAIAECVYEPTTNKDMGLWYYLPLWMSGRRISKYDLPAGTRLAALVRLTRHPIPFPRVERIASRFGWRVS